MALQCRRSPYVCSPERRSVFKRRTPSNHAAYIQLPNFRTTIIPFKTLQRHVPTLFHTLRERGNRRIDPVADLMPYITNYGQQETYEDAVSWIFLHVREQQFFHCHFHQPRMAEDMNPLELIRQCFDYEISQGNLPQAWQLLIEGMDIFQVIGTLLSGDYYGISPQILELYFDTTLLFVPLIAEFPQEAGPLLFELVKSVCDACGDQLTTAERFVRQLGYVDRQELADYTRNLAFGGDVFAIALAGGMGW